jgi:hypothetical protein
VLGADLLGVVDQVLGFGSVRAPDNVQPSR